MVMFGCTSSMLYGMEQKSKFDKAEALVFEYFIKLKQFHCAVLLGDIKAVSMMLAAVPEEQKTAFVMATDKELLTELHYAVSKGHIEIAKMLIAAVPVERRCELVRAKSISGFTALHTVAAFGGQIELVRMLIDAVPESQRREFVMDKSFDGGTAAICARGVGYTALAEMLERYDTGWGCSLQ